MTEFKEKKKSLTEYDELKDKRQKDLVNQLQEYVKNLKKLASLKDYVYCQDKASISGEYDEIEQKLCLRLRKKVFENTIIKVLPELSQHSFNFQQCMLQCEKNNISYLVANQSCKGVYQKNFVKSTEVMSKKLKQEGII